MSTFIELSENFTTKETACRCGCGAGKRPEHFHPFLVPFMQAVRYVRQGPLYASSWARCPNHNLASKGEPQSQHICIPGFGGRLCKAADVFGVACKKVRDMRERGEEPTATDLIDARIELNDIAAVMVAHNPNIGLCVYHVKLFVHGDVRGFKIRWPE